MSNYVNRYYRIIDKFDKLKIDAFLISNPLNIRYLTGLVLSEAELILTPGKGFLFVDSRYLLDAQQHKFDFAVEVIQFKDKFKDIPVWFQDQSIEAIGVESGFLSHKTFLTWQEKISGRVFPCEDLVEKIRIFKDASEIGLIQKAIDLSAEVIKKIPDLLKNSLGRTEKDVCLEIEYLIKKEGAERIAFDIIVATGERSAMPHALPTDQKIRDGEVILIDMGAIIDGYHSDLTRIFVIGERIKRIEDLFGILKEAQAKAIHHVRPGVSAKEVDLLTRQVIDRAGYGSFFGHGTGHGVGLEIHELPKISPTGEMILGEGMVFTIEPGIYLPNQMGLRLEDVVLVTSQGVKVLSEAISREIVWIK